MYVFYVKFNIPEHEILIFIHVIKLYANTVYVFIKCVIIMSLGMPSSKQIFIMVVFEILCT